MKHENKAKAISVYAAALFVAMGSSMPSFAAGWEQQGDSWIYTDNAGNRLTDTWRQSGNHYYYLGSDGVMVTGQWVDDTYYVNDDGVRLTNQWIYAAEEDYSAPNSEGGWFYLDANGRVVTNGWRTINNQRYYFNDDGVMQYGWLNLDDYLYYLGDENDGAMKTGWLALDMDDDENPEDGEVNTIVSYGDMGTWFYFQENGRAVKASDSNTYANRRINGNRYYFDENGKMVTGWVEVGQREAGDSTGISTLKYFGGPDEGQMATGWRYLTDDPEDSDNDRNFNFSVATSSNAQRAHDYDSDGAWYYFNSNGVPEYLSDNADNLADATTRINGQYYFFDEYGRMQSGLLGFRMDDGTVVSAYFGANDSDGAMKRERQTSVIDEEGERGTYYFNGSGNNRGGGYTGERSGYLYYNGKLVEAEEGEDFQVYEVGGRLYLVNESGRVQTGNRTYRVNGEYRYEYNNGTIYYINDERERIGEVMSGQRLPEISYRAIYSL
ncbi:MAG: hypothetical protein ACI4TF_09530 [Oliverpabstia sp.]